MSVISRLKVWIGSDTADLDKGLKRSKKDVSSFGSSMKKLGGMIAGAFAINSIVSFRRECIELAKVQAAAEKKLEAVIKATGGAAGLTSEEMKKYASQLQNVTMYGDEVTIDAMAIMSTFKSIKGDVFKDAIASAQDMATVLNTDLNGAVMQIGKALETPETGLTALRRSGVSFSQEQIKQIKQLVTEGDKQAAQLIMLKELQNEFGGAARAAAGDGHGAITQLKNAWGDFKEVIGNALTPSSDLVKDLTRNVQECTSVISDKTIPTWKKWLGLIHSGTNIENKLHTQRNALMQETNEEEIKLLKLYTLDINALLGKQNIYRQVNKEQGNYFKQTYDAITAELKKRGEGIAAETEELRAKKAAVAEVIANEEKKKLAIESAFALEEKTIVGIGKKIKAIQELKSATDVSDSASVDYYNREITRLNTIIRKTEELSQKRILDTIKKREGGAVNAPKKLFGVEDAANEINADMFPGYKDLSKLPEKLEPLKTALQEIKTEAIDLSNVVNSAFENMAVGFGENIGELISGSGDLKGFAQLVAGTFADMAINVGKTAISTGIAVFGIKAALKSLNPYLAIAAGAALVALGTAVKSSLGGMADGGSGGGTFSGGGGMSNSIDTRGSLQPSTNLTTQPVSVVVSGQFKAKGGDLIAVIDTENTRKKYTT